MSNGEEFEVLFEDEEEQRAFAAWLFCRHIPGRRRPQILRCREVGDLSAYQYLCRCYGLYAIVGKKVYVGSVAVCPALYVYAATVNGTEFDGEI